jgi:hypothetical protein
MGAMYPLTKDGGLPETQIQEAGFVLDGQRARPESRHRAHAATGARHPQLWSVQHALPNDGYDGTD